MLKALKAMVFMVVMGPLVIMLLGVTIIAMVIMNLF